MFLRKYLNEFYFELLLENYDEQYLNTISEENFIEIYNLFQKHNCYFINDIILKYLEIFSMDAKAVDKSLNDLKEKLGNKFVYLIGDDMRYIQTIIDNSALYEIGMLN